MGEAKRRKEIALQRNLEFDLDPIVVWTKADWEKLVTTFGKLTKPSYLQNVARKGFQQRGRGVVMLSIYEGKPMATYLPSSTILLDLYESGFKNRLQERLYNYNPKTQLILVVTYSDIATSDECTYDYIPWDF